MSTHKSFCFYLQAATKSEFSVSAIENGSCNNTRLGAVDALEGKAAIQDINRLEKWVDRKVREFNEGDCKVL